MYFTTHFDALTTWRACILRWSLQDDLMQGVGKQQVKKPKDALKIESNKGRWGMYRHPLQALPFKAALFNSTKH